MIKAQKILKSFLGLKEEMNSMNSSKAYVGQANDAVWLLH